MGEWKINRQFIDRKFVCFFLFILILLFAMINFVGCFGCSTMLSLREKAHKKIDVVGEMVASVRTKPQSICCPSHRNVYVMCVSCVCFFLSSFRRRVFRFNWFFLDLRILFNFCILTEKFMVGYFESSKLINEKIK